MESVLILDVKLSNLDMVAGLIMLMERQLDKPKLDRWEILDFPRVEMITI